MILKQFFPYFLILLISVSCYKYDKPQKPENLISKDKMVDIILDVRLLSSATGANKTILDENNLQAQRYVYKKYNIDSLQFVLSNNYYAYYVEDYKAIYNKVKDSLEALKEKFDKIIIQETKEKAFRDSINEVIMKDAKRILKLKENLSVLVKKDSLKILTKKDSIVLIKTKDTLDLLLKKDSLSKAKLKTKTEKKLIKPVSDKDFQ